MANPQKISEPLSGLTHLIGTGLSIAGLVLLIVYACIFGNIWQIVAYSIFGASMVLLYLASTLYHLIPMSAKTKHIFQRIDHSMIFVLISGTYTAICLTIFRGPWGWTIWGIAIALAIFGIIIKALWLKIPTWLSLFIYIGMGWLITINLIPYNHSFSFNFFWLLLGGILYTIGTIFYSLDNKLPRTKWFGMHEIFHLFVMAGTFCHFWFIFKIIL